MGRYRDIKNATAEVVSVRLVRKTSTTKAHAAIRDVIVSNPGMSYQEILLVSIDLDRLNQRIEQRAAALKSPLPDVDALQMQLEKKLEEAKAKGKISAAPRPKRPIDRLNMTNASAMLKIEIQSSST